MNSIDIENFLNGKGIKPTSNRILVAKELMKHPIRSALPIWKYYWGFQWIKRAFSECLNFFLKRK